MQSRGSVSRSSLSLALLAMAGSRVACSRFVSRAVLSVLLILAVGTAEGIENRFQPTPAAKTKRGSTRRGNPKRTSRMMRSNSPAAHTEVAELGCCEHGVARGDHAPAPVHSDAPIARQATRMSPPVVAWEVASVYGSLRGALSFDAPYLPKPPPAFV